MTPLEKIKSELEKRIEDNKVLPYRYRNLDEDIDLLKFVESVKQQDNILINIPCTIKKQIGGFNAIEYPMEFWKKLNSIDFNTKVELIIKEIND